MQTITTKEADVFISEDVLEEEKDTEGYLVTTEDAISAFIKANPHIIEAVLLYSGLTGLKKIAILSAHGGEHDNRWVYYDKNKKTPVQTWIKKYDGKYAALLFFSCNTAGLTPTSKKSMLIVPDRNVRLQDFGSAPNVIEPVKFTMIVPKIGEIDAYSIDYFIKQWREELQKRKQ